MKGVFLMFNREISRLSQKFVKPLNNTTFWSLSPLIKDNTSSIFDIFSVCCHRFRILSPSEMSTSFITRKFVAKILTKQSFRLKQPDNLCFYLYTINQIQRAANLQYAFDAVAFLYLIELTFIAEIRWSGGKMRTNCRKETD